MHKLIIVLLFLSLSKVTLFAKEGNNKNVTQLFSEAKKLFDSEKYDKALPAFYAILKKYPAHEPSIIFHGKTLYQLNRYDDAYNSFVRVNPRSLDSTTGFEYGKVFYQKKEWRGAVEGFKQVKDGDPLFDLAQYFGGSSAFNLKDYKLAQEMLEKSVVLPDKLAQSRNDLLKALPDLMKQPSPSANAEKKEIPVQTPSPVTAPKSNSYSGSMGIQKEANLGFQYDQQGIDFTGLGEKTSKTQLGYFKFFSGPSLEFPVGQHLSNAIAGLQILVGAEDRQIDGQEYRLIIEDKNPDVIRKQTTKTVISHHQAGELQGQPWVDIPITENMWLGLMGDYYVNFPSFGVEGRNGNRGGGTKYSFINQNMKIFLGLNYDDFYNADLDVVSNRFKSFMSLAIIPVKNLTLGTSLTHESYQYIETSLDGPDSSSTIKLTAKQELPLGVTLMGYVAGGIKANYIGHNLGQLRDVAANSMQVASSVVLKINPISWFTFQLLHTSSKDYWSFANEDDKSLFEKNVPDYIALTSASIILNLYL